MKNVTFYHLSLWSINVEILVLNCQKCNQCLKGLLDCSLRVFSNLLCHCLCLICKACLSAKFSHLSSATNNCSNIFSLAILWLFETSLQHADFMTFWEKNCQNSFSLETFFTCIGTDSLVTDRRRGATNENLAKTDLVNLIRFGGG